MKSIISNVISFISMLLIIFVVSFVLIQISFRDRFLIKSLSNINYYKQAHNNIIQKLNYEIVNEEIKLEYEKYITIDMIKKDIRRIISSKDGISRYKDFYDIIEKHTTDIEICKKYASNVNDVYTNNLFPLREYKIINKLYIKTNECIMYTSVLISIIVVFELLLLIINNSLKYNKVALLASGILFTIPFLFIWISGIFNSFIYTNKYYTKFLIGLVGNIKNSLFLVGLIIIITLCIIELFNRKRKN